MLKRDALLRPVLSALCAGFLALPHAAFALTGTGSGGEGECVRFKAGREHKSGDCGWVIGITNEWQVTFNDEGQDARRSGMSYACSPNRADLPNEEAGKLPDCRALVYPPKDGTRYCAETDVMPGEQCALTLDGAPAAIAGKPPKPSPAWLCLQKSGTDEVMCMKRRGSFAGEEAPAQKPAAMPDAEFIALCASGTAEQVKQALAGGANPNARMNGADDDGTTALIAAAQTGTAETVAALLAAGADKSVEDKRGYDALWYANKSAQYGVEYGGPRAERLPDPAALAAEHQQVVKLLQGGAQKPVAQDAGAFSAADLKRMSTFVSNFVEVLVLPDFDMQKGDAPSNPALIYFGVVHNAINNFKSRVKVKDCQVENCEHGSTAIEARFVAESVRKYFDLNPKHQSHDGGEEGTGLWHFDGKLYHFFWGDGEIRPYAKVTRATKEGGIIRMTGDIYSEDNSGDPPEIIASFVVTAKPHKWNGKDTWAILSLKRQER